MDTLIDWRLISNIINKHYSRGTSAVGTPAYSGLLLFIMSLLQTWYGMSDYDIEDRINDSISFSKFCGLTLEESSPDHSTLSRFRKEMTKKKVYDRLMKALNKQLAKHSIVVKSGVMVDASVVESPLRPKGKAVIYIDRFGNLITSISKKQFFSLKGERRFSLQFNSWHFRNISHLHSHYYEVPEGECFFLFNSLDLLEIGINNGMGDQLFGMNYAHSVIITFIGDKET